MNFPISLIVGVTTEVLTQRRDELQGVVSADRSLLETHLDELILINAELTRRVTPPPGPRP